MPRDPKLTCIPSRAQQRETRVPVWHTAAIAPPRSLDSTANTILMPCYADTPADKFVCSLLDHCGLEWGEGDVDIRRNITLTVWVDIDKVEDRIEKHQKHMLKVKLEPGMFIRRRIVTLDSYVGDDIEGPGAPLWLKRLAGTSPFEFIRVYNWVYLVLFEVLATPDAVVNYVDSWFSLVEYVGHIKELWDTAARPRRRCQIRPRPARRSLDLLAATLEGMGVKDHDQASLAGSGDRLDGVA